MLVQSTAPSPLPRTTARFFAARRLGHVNLYVGDVDRSYRFYKDVVGLNESYVQPLNKAAFMTNNNTHHDVGLIDVRARIARSEVPALNHLGFEIETEVDLVAGYDRATADGMTFFMTQDHDIAHSVYAKDPDGNLSEVYADVVKDWRAVRGGVVTKPKPKWAPGTTPPNPERNYHPSPVLDRVESAIFHPRRIVHVTLVVSDLAGALDFYTRIVGLTPLLGGAGGAFVVLGGTCGERNLVLFRAGAGRKPGLHQSGFELWSETELAQSVDKARASGLKIEFTVDHPSRRSVFLRDPDGFLLQFFVDRGLPLQAIADLPEDIAIYVA